MVSKKKQAKNRLKYRNVLAKEYGEQLADEMLDDQKHHRHYTLIPKPKTTE